LARLPEWSIIRPAGQAPFRRSRLSSNVRLHLQLTALAWSFTAAVLVHNAEEAAFLPRWSRSAARWYRPVSDSEFRFAVGVLSAFFLALTFAATLAVAPCWLVKHLFAGYVVAMLANALVPHLAATVALRRYMPGTATAWLLVVPLGAVFLHSAVQQGQVELHVLAWVAPTVALVLLAAIPLLLLAGRRLWPSSRRANSAA